MRGAHVSRSLNWSGAMSGNKSRDGLKSSNLIPKISEACISAFSPTLERLDLSHNGIQYYSAEEKIKNKAIHTRNLIANLGWLQELEKLSYLNLSNNHFHQLDTTYFQITKRIDERAQSQPACIHCGVDIAPGIKFRKCQ